MTNAALLVLFTLAALTQAALRQMNDIQSDRRQS
jgi:hypothetical protein